MVKLIAKIKQRKYFIRSKIELYCRKSHIHYTSSDKMFNLTFANLCTYLYDRLRAASFINPHIFIPDLHSHWQSKSNYVFEYNLTCKVC